jgi:ubiquinone biosynthesis protein UbiJ
MTGSPDDVQFQILEHLRVLREEMARLHARLDRLEQQAAAAAPAPAKA